MVLFQKDRIFRILFIFISFTLISVISAIGIFGFWPKQFVKVEKNSISTPTFKKSGGVYAKPFLLRIDVPCGTRVYYTTDCTVPTTASTLYKEPIYIYNKTSESNKVRAVKNVIKNYNKYWEDPGNVDKGFVVRAIAVDSFDRMSEVVTQTYFIGLNEYKNSNIVSIVAEPSDLFGEDGIYVTGKEYDDWLRKGGDSDIWTEDEPVCNFQKRGKEWERSASFEYFEDSKSIANQCVGIRIQGGNSRSGAIKRFSIFSRKKYSGNNYFDSAIVNGNVQHSLYTRSGDLQWISQKLGKKSDLLTVDGKIVIIFINGEYLCGEETNWYLYEKFDERNIAKKYQSDERNISIVKNGATEKSANAGANGYYLIEDYLKTHNCSLDESFLGLNKIIDMQSYIENVCFNMYFANLDVSETWNNIYWRNDSTKYSDNRWRMGLYDIDTAWKYIDGKFVVNAPYEINPFYMRLKNQIPIGEWKIFSAFRQNQLFKENFIKTFVRLISDDFDYKNVETILKGTDIKNEEYYDFFKNRASYMIKFLKEEFSDFDDIIKKQ